MSDNHDLLNDKDVCSFEEHEAENVCSNKDAVAACIRCIRTRSLISGKMKTASVCWYGAASITTWATRSASYSTKTSTS